MFDESAPDAIDKPTWVLHTRIIPFELADDLIKSALWKNVEYTTSFCNVGEVDSQKSEESAAPKKRKVIGIY